MLVPGVLFFFTLLLFVCSLLTKRAKKRKSLRTGTLVLLMLAVLTSVIPLFFVLKKEVERFDKRKWMQNVDARWKMAPDLINGKLLLGKDSNYVQALLGEPSAKENAISQWSYYMGGGVEGLGFHFDHLSVIFKKGVVADVVHHKAHD